MTGFTAARKASPGVVLIVVTAMTLSFAADTMMVSPVCDIQAPAVSGPAPVRHSGKLIVLPGSANTKYHLAGFVRLAAQQLPGFEIDFRPWGIPFLALHNLQAHERNAETARRMSREIVRWRRDHPEELLYIFGYSGGGGMATLIVSELPEDVTVDRVVLLAPAISPDYPMKEHVLPRVTEFVANYASTVDVQVGWGTRMFGTIDGVESDSAGVVGFSAVHPDILQWHWSESDRVYGHRGNHRAYLGPRWQSAFLLPVLDPRFSADDVRALWAAACEMPAGQ